MFCTVYTFTGRLVAQQERTRWAIYSMQRRVYLRGDHLGSVSAATDATGAVLSRQAFTPWGEPRAGGGDVTQTTKDFTGQLRDGTGLLFYNTPYYDPKLGRFTGAESIVPGTASAKGGTADKPDVDADRHARLAAWS